MFSVIKPKFRFFQMKIECAFVNTSELAQPGFGNRPEVFDSIDMILAFCKFIFSMPDSIVFSVSKIHKAIISFKGIRVKLRFFSDSFINNWQQLRTGTIVDDLSVDHTTSFYYTKNDIFSSCSSDTKSSYPSCSKVAFIYLYFALLKWTFIFRKLCNSLSYRFNYFCNATSANSCQLSNFNRFNIKRKKPDYLPEF